MLLFLPHLPTISRPRLRVRAPVVKVRNLECAVQDSKTLQKHTQTIINQRKLRDINSHPIAHQPSVINGRCIPPNYRFLMRPSVTGIGQSVRQLRETLQQCWFHTSFPTARTLACFARSVAHHHVITVDEVTIHQRNSPSYRYRSYPADRIRPREARSHRSERTSSTLTPKRSRYSLLFHVHRRC